jgi:tryptophan synthase alpha subunit
MGWQRIQTSFHAARQAGRVALWPFLTAGYPDEAATLELVPALEQAGACGLELGVPFSDPLADGATIQRASFQAIRSGMTLARCIALCRQLRAAGVTMPIILMGYYNPILAMGLEETARQAAKAEADGFIVADLPAEEAGPFAAACQRHDLALVPLLAPTSTDERIALTCHGARGFVYCVSLTGVTGARGYLPPAVAELVGRVRRHTSLPIVVGFGVSRREHVEAIGQYADGAVVGSALIDALDAAPRPKIASQVREFLESLMVVKSAQRARP